jgi:hypothetical protein
MSDSIFFTDNRAKFNKDSLQQAVGRHVKDSIQRSIESPRSIYKASLISPQSHISEMEGTTRKSCRSNMQNEALMLSEMYQNSVNIRGELKTII